MKNFKLLTILGFLLVLVSSSPMIQAQELPVGLDTVGVNNGDSFNVLVVNNTIDLEGLGIELSDLDFDFASLGITSLNLEYYDATNDVTISPDEGDIVVVEVVDTENGKISLSLDGATVEVATGFLLGTPVAFVNWDLWETYLGDLEVTIETESDIELTLAIENGAEVFSVDVDVSFPIPAEFQQTLTSFSVNLLTEYSKDTGIQEKLKITVVTDGESILVKRTMALQYTLTDQEPPEPTSTSESEEGTGPDLSVPGFEFAIPLLTMGVLAVLINRKRK
jgi:hypothetical protein